MSLSNRRLVSRKELLVPPPSRAPRIPRNRRILRPATERFLKRPDRWRHWCSSGSTKRRGDLFFALYKTTERNGDAITDEDLLHGIALGGPAAIELLGGAAADAFRSAESPEQFVARMDDRDSWITPSHKEIPFSPALKRVLQLATAESDALSHNYIGPEHLLLGLLRDEATNAWRRLNEAGVRLSDVRSRVKARREAGPAA